jgi:hypothetical protein
LDQEANDLGSNSDYDEEPLRFRSLNEVYDDTTEVELASDSEVDALLALMEEPVMGGPSTRVARAMALVMAQIAQEQLFNFGPSNISPTKK